MGKPKQLEFIGRSDRDGGAVQRKKKPQRFLLVFTKVLLSTCAQENFPRLGKEPLERIGGKGA